VKYALEPMGRFNFLRRKTGSGKNRRLLLGLSNDLVVALVAEGKRVIARISFRDGDERQYLTAFADWLKAESVSGLPCDIALLQGHYQMVQIDKPAVEEHELADALVWSIKDLVSIAPEQLQVDYIDIPAGANNSRINVCAADATKLAPWIELLVKNKSQPQLVTTEELALVESANQQQFPVLILSQHGNHELLLMVAYQQQLFVSRRIRGFNGMDAITSNSLMLDSLILETQRAMDYFESGMRQPPVKQIWLNFDMTAPQPLIDAMGSALPLEISPLANILDAAELSAGELVLTSLASRQEEAS